MRDALKEEQDLALKEFRAKRDAEQAEFDKAWDIRWRELQTLCGFRT